MLSRVRSHDAERGAVAILVVLFVLLVGLPAGALGLSTYVRSTAQAELQQTANAAALAGASSIPLADLDYALAYTGATGAVQEAGGDADAALARADARLAAVERRTDQDLPQLQGSLPDAPLVGQTVVINPLANACAQARLSARAMPFGGSFTAAAPAALSNPEGLLCQADADAPAGTPSSLDGWSGAKYYRDSSVVGALGDCINQTRRALSLVPVDVRSRLPGRVERTLAEAEAAVDGLAGVLPALLRPGVIVQVRQSVSGPLDGVLGSAGPSEQIVTARARRRVKNLVVVPYDPRVPLDAVTAANDVSDGVKAALIETSDLLDAVDAELEGLSVPVPAVPDAPETGTPLDRVVDRVGDRVDGALPDSVSLPPLPLGECADIIDAAVNDYDDALAPAETSSATDILRQAAEGSEPVIVVLTGPNSTFYDTVPVCLTQPARVAVAQPLPDTDGNGIPDEVRPGAEVDIRLDQEQVVSGAACAPGTPGAFRASLVR